MKYQSIILVSSRLNPKNEHHELDAQVDNNSGIHIFEQIS